MPEGATKPGATVLATLDRPAALMSLGVSALFGGALLLMTLISVDGANSGRGVGPVIWMAIAWLAIAPFGLRFVSLLHRMATGGPAVYVRGGRLIYLNAMVGSLPVHDIRDIVLTTERQGFGPLRHLALQTLGGRRMYVPIFLLKEGPGEVIASIKGLIVSSSPSREAGLPA